MLFVFYLCQSTVFIHKFVINLVEQHKLLSPSATKTAISASSSQGTVVCLRGFPLLTVVAFSIKHTDLNGEDVMVAALISICLTN